MVSEGAGGKRGYLDTSSGYLEVQWMSWKCKRQAVEVKKMDQQITAEVGNELLHSVIHCQGQN